MILGTTYCSRMYCTLSLSSNKWVCGTGEHERDGTWATFSDMSTTRGENDEDGMERLMHKSMAFCMSLAVLYPLPCLDLSVSLDTTIRPLGPSERLALLLKSDVFDIRRAIKDT